MPTSHIEWTTVLGRLEQTVAALRHANRSDMGEGVEHLEAALAIADETQDEEAGNLIERALDSVRAAHWPTLDPNLETFRKGKR